MSKRVDPTYLEKPTEAAQMVASPPKTKKVHKSLSWKGV